MEGQLLYEMSLTFWESYTTCWKYKESQSEHLLSSYWQISRSYHLTVAKFSFHMVENLVHRQIVLECHF